MSSSASSAAGGDIYKHTHFYRGSHHSFPVASESEACVDFQMPRYLVQGQCCAKNPAKEEAMLVNPMWGYKYWKTLSGERLYTVKCTPNLGDQLPQSS
jgi:hypothetical protein